MIHLKALAKLNLFLHVLYKRDDGYHALDSLVVFTDLCDTIIVHENGRGNLTVAGPFASLIPADTSSNLIERLRVMLAAHLPVITKWDIELQKNIPVGAGLGGGSADAAAILSYARDKYKLDDTVIVACANALGSDVLACLDTRHKIMRGRGEILIPHPQLAPRPCLILWPQHALATASIFQNFKIENERTHVTTPLTWDDISVLGNDLTPNANALCPAIKDMFEALRSCEGCVFARMTGSGSAVFAIFENGAHCDNAAQNLNAQHPHWWVHVGSTN